MKILSWNIKGFNNLGKQRDVKDLLQSFSSDIVCLVETRTSSQNMSSTAAHLWRNAMWISNHTSSPAGRIVVLWNHLSCNMIKLWEMDQLMHFSVVCHTCVEFKLTVIYGSPRDEPWFQLWLDLWQVSQTITGPWLVCSDFNTTRYLPERKGGKVESPRNIEDILHKGPRSRMQTICAKVEHLVQASQLRIKPILSSEASYVD